MVSASARCLAALLAALLPALAATPAEVARELARHYGHELPEVVYIPALAVIARLKLGEREDVEKIVGQWRGRDTLAKPTGSHLAGHLLFGELARSSRDPWYLERARAAADMAFDKQGQPLAAMPLHNEMSDSVFMGCPILAQVGRLTGESKYFDMCLRHLRFMRELDLRPDGIYRHSPLNEAAWGRGNGFPALGVALSLQEFPESHPGRGELLGALRAHLTALLKHQDREGMWHQVIDVPASYPEFTATAMIGFAMLRGIRGGWLPEAQFGPAARRAWDAIQKRIGAGGSLQGVCPSTGKLKTLQEYLDRPPIFGKDPRGGAMGLLIATEMMAAR